MAIHITLENKDDWTKGDYNVPAHVFWLLDDEVEKVLVENPGYFSSCKKLGLSGNSIDVTNPAPPQKTKTLLLIIG